MSEIIQISADSIDHSCDWIRLNTFKEGLLSRMGHDLLLEARQFSLSFEKQKDKEFKVTGELSVSDLVVIEPKNMSKKDQSDIQSHIVSHLPSNPSFEGLLTFQSDSSGMLSGSFSVGKGSASVSSSFGLDGKRANGKIELSHKALHIKPFRAPLGVIRLKDKVILSFSLDLSALFEESVA